MNRAVASIIILFLLCAWLLTGASVLECPPPGSCVADLSLTDYLRGLLFGPVALGMLLAMPTLSVELGIVFTLAQVVVFGWAVFTVFRPIRGSKDSNTERRK